jgi:Tol biopolymer transport system component
VRSLGAPDRYAGLQVSRDGTEALAFVDDAVGNRDIWRVELTRGERNRITLDNRGNFAAWSPDARRMAFSGMTRQTLFEKSAGGSAADRELLRSDYAMYPSDWSADGRVLLYVQDSPGRSYDLWALPLDGASKPTPILQSAAGELHGTLSPNGEFIAFTSDESGRDEVYLQRFADSTTRRPVSTKGGAFPRWSRKGNELFFRSFDGHLVAVPVRFNGNSADLGAPRIVMPLIESPAVHLYPYDVAADGRILALTPVAGAANNISLAVLLDWHLALRQ